MPHNPKCRGGYCHKVDGPVKTWHVGYGLVIYLCEACAQREGLYNWRVRDKLSETNPQWAKYTSKLNANKVQDAGGEMSHGREQDGYCPHCGKSVPLIERLTSALRKIAALGHKNCEALYIARGALEEMNANKLQDAGRAGADLPQQVLHEAPPAPQEACVQLVYGRWWGCKRCRKLLYDGEQHTHKCTPTLFDRCFDWRPHAGI